MVQNVFTKIRRRCDDIGVLVMTPDDQMTQAHLNVIENTVETWKDIIRNMYVLAANTLKATRIVELGTGENSTRIFLSALESTGGILYSVDLHPEHVPEKLKDHAQFRFLPGDSVKAALNWDKGDIDILLCDSDHSYQHVLSELRSWGKFNPKITFVHDTFFLKDPPNPETAFLSPPYDACKTYSAQTGKKFINICVYTGLGVIEG